VADAAQSTIDWVLAVKESEHRMAATAYLFECAPDAKIASRRHHPFFEDVDGIAGAPALVVNLRKVQIKLGVVGLHPQRFAAQHFPVSESLLRGSREQPRIGQIKRILGSGAQSAADVGQRLSGIAVA
jgi:hypothetical protein